MRRHSTDLQSVRTSSEVERAIRDLLPWGASILFHVALVLAALLVVWSTMKEDVDDDLPPATVQMWSDVRQPALSVMTNSTLLIPVKREREIDVEPTPPREMTIADATPAPDLIGVKGGPSSKSPVAGGSGAGDGNPFAMPPGGGAANRVVYVIDASGSLIDGMPTVLAQLRAAILSLPADASFSIIFFQDGNVLALPQPVGLRPATKGAKRPALAWLDSGVLEPRGKTSPVPAILTALRYEPDVLFLLSDNMTGQGRYELDQVGLLDEVEQVRRRVVIHTIQFLRTDPLEDAGLPGTLAELARRSGGTYRYIPDMELKTR